MPLVMDRYNLIRADEDSVRRAPMLRVVTPFALGISIASYFDCVYSLWLLSLISLLITLLIGVVCRLNRSRISITLSKIKLRGVLVFAIIVLSGVLYSTVTVTPKIAPAFHSDRDLYIEFEEYPSVKEYGCRSIVNCYLDRDSYLDREVSFKAVLYSNLEDSTVTPGYSCIALSTPRLISSRDNPYQFDYSSYMARQGIYYTVSIIGDEYSLIAPTDSDLDYIDTVRRWIVDNYIEAGIYGDELEILKAITIGERSSISEGVRESFSKSGAIHILAVSGLHVGIIAFIINLALSFLGIRGWQLWLKIVLSITTLSLYAILAGGSPSVIRATVMFSLLSIGFNISRPTNGFNTLAISALIMLVLDPTTLFDLGFQLSYSAIAGILYFTHKLESLVNSRWSVVSKVWTLISVSLAAQLGTTPLMFLYFHSVSTLSVLLSLIVIPATAIIIYLAIVLHLCSVVSLFLYGYVALIISKVIGALIYITEIVGSLPISTVDGYFPSVLETIVLYLIILLGSRVLLKREYRYRSMLYTLIIISVGLFNCSRLSNQQLIVYSTNSRGRVVQVVSNRGSFVFADSWVESRQIEQLIAPVQERYGIDRGEYSRVDLQSDTALINNSLFLYRRGTLIMDDFSVKFNMNSPYMSERNLFYMDSSSRVSDLIKELSVREIMFEYQIIEITGGGLPQEDRFICETEANRDILESGVVLYSCKDRGALVLKSSEFLNLFNIGYSKSAKNFANVYLDCLICRFKHE